MAHRKEPPSEKYKKPHKESRRGEEVPEGNISTAGAAAAAGIAAGAAAGIPGGLPGMAIGAVIGGATGAVAAEIAIDVAEPDHGPEDPEGKKHDHRKH